MVGIVSYGTYIPYYRIKTADIASVWSKDANAVISSLGVREKSVPAYDEDAVTMAFESASEAVAHSHIKPTEINAVFVGSESHPYAVNPTSTIVGELLGVDKNYLAFDTEFACKAATSAIQAMVGLIASKNITYGLSIGTDTAQAKPHDILEYTAAAGSASFLLGKNKVIAKLIAFDSYSSDTPDFWRRDGIRYPSHQGRFTGEPAYFAHIIKASKIIMEKSRVSPKDFDWCVFHAPNGKFPRVVAGKLGFSESQLANFILVDRIGNPYSASSLLGLAAVLDIALPKQKIFMASYGSGAGSDVFIWETTGALTRFQKKSKVSKVNIEKKINHKKYINYIQYLKHTHVI